MLSGASRERTSLAETKILYTWGMGSDNLNIDVVFDLVTFWSLVSTGRGEDMSCCHAVFRRRF